MTTLKPREVATKTRSKVNLKAFLADLGELSRHHGIGVGDGATLYVMEREDYSRSYLTNEQSELTFA